jgi:hypothetical protein
MRPDRCRRKNPTAEAIIAERTSTSEELQKSVASVGAEKQSLVEQLRAETADRAAVEAEVAQLRISLEDQAVTHQALMP